MTRSTWQTISRGCGAIFVAGLVGAWFSYTLCVFNVAGSFGRDLNPLTEKHLEELRDKALTKATGEVPTDFGGRAALAAPVCRKNHPHRDSVPFYLLAGFGLVGFLFARNQSKIDPIEEIERQRRLLDEDRGPAPSEIDVGDIKVGLTDKDREILDSVGRIDSERDDSLMLYLDKKDEPKVKSEPEDIDGFYCPPGLGKKPVVYVDPRSESASDEVFEDIPRENDPGVPFKSLAAALRYAGVLATKHWGAAQVRLAPGVYQTAVDIPSGVSLVNHRLPFEGNSRDRLKWLTEQTPESDDCVTLLTPEAAKYAVRFESGSRQGIFGCHVVGRESVKQAGIVGVNTRAVAIVHCRIEGFTGGAARLQDSGTEVPGTAVTFSGCIIRRNSANIGAAVYAQRSSIKLIDCLIEGNEAETGGALYGVDLKGPLVIEGSRVVRNKAVVEEVSKSHPDKTEPNEWQNISGLGGGLFLKGSKLKVVGSEFVENSAALAGGAMALLGTKSILESGEEYQLRLARNKAPIGAGVFTVGWPAADATLKIDDLVAENNRAIVSGGTICLVGICKVLIMNSVFESNETTGDKSVGGAVACHMGGELSCRDTKYTDNKSAGSGGALAAINARLNISDGCSIRANLAKRSGGGIYAVTTSNAIVERMIQNKALKVPFITAIAGAKVSNNASTNQGGGLRGGNESKSPTLPMGFKVADDVTFQLNRTKSQQENGDDIWILWAGEVKGTDRDRPEKLVLK